MMTIKGSLQVSIAIVKAFLADFWSKIWLSYVTCKYGVAGDLIFGFPDPALPIHHTTFMMLRWRLRVVYWWASPLLSDFGRKFSKSTFGTKFRHFGQKQDLNVNFNYLNPKGLNIAWFRAIWYIVHQDPLRGLTLRLSEEEGIMYIKKNDSSKNAHLPRRPPWTDLHQIWQSGSPLWPNHPRQLFGNRLSGFESVRGRILPFSYLQAVAVSIALALPRSLWW